MRDTPGRGQVKGYFTRHRYGQRVRPGGPVELLIVGISNIDAYVLVLHFAEFIERRVEDIVERLPSEAENVEDIQLRIFDSSTCREAQAAPQRLHSAGKGTHSAEGCDDVH